MFARKKKSPAFTLLYALFTVSLLLVVSSYTFTIIIKELKVSTFNKDVHLAQYAAESALECGHYWSLRGVLFNGTASSTISCSGANYTNATTSINLSFANGTCANLRVTPGDPVVLVARGYNTCTTSSMFRIERVASTSHDAL